jgi:hypothetical protein
VRTFRDGSRVRWDELAEAEIGGWWNVLEHHSQGLALAPDDPGSDEARDSVDRQPDDRVGGEWAVSSPVEIAEREIVETGPANADVRDPSVDQGTGSRVDDRDV